jgi:aldehyde:ferredoxin oxidoreductase|tara:strand:+ start:223 stop:438 length:216 start_codon:yes stop_codon:yes gene_type:complete
MDKLVVEANKRRKMNYKQAIKIVLELAQKEIDNNEATYDVPNLVKDGTSVNLEKAEEAFEVVEEEIENLPY